jgi:hypothetical protein
MRVRYDKRVGIVCLVAAIVLGTLAAVSDDLSFVGALTPVVLLGFGVAFLTRPYLLVDDQALIVQALIGPAQETYRLEAADVVEFDGKRVFLVRENERRKIGVRRWIADKRDWAAFRAWGERRTRRA